VLLRKGWLWAASAKSLPMTYRWDMSLPPVCEIGLYVTDRRVLPVAHMFRLVTQECSLWYEGRNPPDDQELIKEVSVGSHMLLGPYLEVISEDPARHWYRSDRLRLRLFMKSAEQYHEVIAAVMGTTS
jgi:hypothetical protein